MENEMCPCGLKKKFRNCCGKTINYGPAKLLQKEKGRYVYRDSDMEYDVPAILGIDGKTLRAAEFESSWILIGTLAKVDANELDANIALELLDDLIARERWLVLYLLQVVLVTKARVDYDEDLLRVCFLGLEQALGTLRANAERDNDWAKHLIDYFQNIMIDLVLGELEDTDVGATVASLIREAKIPLNPKLSQSMLEAREKAHEDVVLLPVPEAMPKMFDHLLETLPNHDPFDVFELFVGGGTAWGPEYQSILLEWLVKSNHEVAQEVAPLFVLHDNSNVRCDLVAYYLSRFPDIGISPRSLRRLICTRNWLAIEEAKNLDLLIKKARQKGVECAPLKKPESVDFVVSPVDGSGTQMVWGHVRNGEDHQMVSILLRQGFGIWDATVSSNVTVADVKNIFHRSKQGVGSQKVSSQYVDKLLAFFLNVAKERGNTPGVYLLKIAEVLGILNWIPSSDPLNEDIATIGRQVVPGRVRLRTIGKSHAWLFHSGLDSWFEDVADVNKIVAPHVRRLLADGAILDKLAIRILDQIIEPKRQTWVERLELMAVFSQEAKAKSLPNPKEFMVLAEEVKQSVQLNQIPLMLEIGRRSVASATMRLANLSQ